MRGSSRLEYLRLGREITVQKKTVGIREEISSLRKNVKKARLLLIQKIDQFIEPTLTVHSAQSICTGFPTYGKERYNILLPEQS